MQCANSIKTELELRWWENNKQGKNKVYANNAQCLTTKNPWAMKVQKREARGYTRDCSELGATGIQLNFTGTKNLLLWLEFSVRNEKCNKKTRLVINWNRKVTYFEQTVPMQNVFENFPQSVIRRKYEVTVHMVQANLSSDISRKHWN